MPKKLTRVLALKTNHPTPKKNLGKSGQPSLKVLISRQGYRPQAGGFYTWKHENSTIQPPASRDRDLTRFIVTLHQEVKNWLDKALASDFQGISVSTDRRVEKGHHRLEKRLVWAVPLSEFGGLYKQEQWSGLQTIVMLERTRHLWNKVTHEVQFYLSSLPADASYTNSLNACYTYSINNKFPSRQRTDDFSTQFWENLWHSISQGIQIFKETPLETFFEMFPESFNGINLWTIRRLKK